MNAHSQPQPGSDGFVHAFPSATGEGWEFGFATWEQIREWMGPPKPPEPATTADMAGEGQQLGSQADVLRVAALLRCHTEGAKVGAVLYLDRSRRDLPPLWLAELLQVDIGRVLSTESASGHTTDGDRLRSLDAVVIPSARVPVNTRAYVRSEGSVSHR